MCYIFWVFRSFHDWTNIKALGNEIGHLYNYDFSVFICCELKHINITHCSVLEVIKCCSDLKKVSQALRNQVQSVAKKTRPNIPFNWSILSQFLVGGSTHWSKVEMAYLLLLLLGLLFFSLTFCWKHISLQV